jgi:hypothetical protein
MTVLLASISRARPERRRDIPAIALEGAKLLTRHGATSCRLSVADLAGEASNTWVFSAEWPTGEAYGATMDEMTGDAEAEGFVEMLYSNEAPMEMLSTSLLSEIELGRSPSGQAGSVTEAYVSRIRPGRLEDAIALGPEAFDFLERNGARNGRLFMTTAGGSMTETLVASWEFENMRAYGRCSDAFESDEGRALLQKVMGADSPTITISSGVYRDIPLH